MFLYIEQTLKRLLRANYYTLEIYKEASLKLDPEEGLLPIENQDESRG